MGSTNIMWETRTSWINHGPEPTGYELCRFTVYKQARVNKQGGEKYSPLEGAKIPSGCQGLFTAVGRRSFLDKSGYVWTQASKTKQHFTNRIRSTVIIHSQYSIEVSCRQWSGSVPYAMGNIKMKKTHTCPQKAYNGLYGMITEGTREQSMEDIGEEQKRCTNNLWPWSHGTQVSWPSAWVV